MAAMKINLMKIVCTVNTIASGKRSLLQKKFTQKFIMRKFLYMKICRSTLLIYACCTANSSTIRTDQLKILQLEDLKQG